MDTQKVIAAICESEEGLCCQVTTFFHTRSKQGVKYPHAYIDILDDGYGSYNCHVRTLDGTVFLVGKCADSVEEAVQSIEWDAIDDGTAARF